MFRAVLLGVFFIGAIGACAARDAPTGHTEEAQTTTIPLDLSGPRPVVQLTVNGGPQQRAVFDTGATSTIVNIDSASALGLRNEGPLLAPFDRAHAGSGYQSTLRGAVLGGRALPPLSVPVMTSPLRDAVAIFSPNTFAGELVTLDFATAELRIAPKSARTMPPGESYGYSAPPFALPTMPVHIGDQTFAAHLDTGSPVGLLLPLAYSEQVPLDGPPEQIGVARTHAGEMPIYRARILGQITVGPLLLDNPEVRFTDVVSNVNVGMALLRQLVITLDPAEQRVWVRAR